MRRNCVKNLLLIGALILFLGGISNTVVKNREQAMQEQQHIEAYHKIYVNEFGTDVEKQEIYNNEKLTLTFAELSLSATNTFASIVTKDAMDIKIISNTDCELVKVNDLVYHVKFTIDKYPHGKVLLVITSNDSVVMHATREY